MSSYQFFASLSISLSMISPNNKISHLYGSILRQLLTRPSPVLSTGFEEKRAAAIRSTTTTAEEEDNLNLQFPKDESFVDISQPESIGGSFDCPREDAPENTIPIHDSLQLVIFQFNVSPDLSSGMGMGLYRSLVPCHRYFSPPPPRTLLLCRPKEKTLAQLLPFCSGQSSGEFIE